MSKKPTVPAEHFMGTLQANVDNEKLSDADFREFVRNTLPIIIFPRIAPRVTAPVGTPEWKEQVVAREDWLDQCYADTEDVGRTDDELSFNEQHRKL